MYLLCLPPETRGTGWRRRELTPELGENGRGAEEERPPAVTDVAEPAGQTPHRAPAAAGAVHDEQTPYRNQRRDNEEHDASSRGHASHHSETHPGRVSRVLL